MKVIDLLNKIANNEELPVKIKWCGVKFYLKDKIKYYDYENSIGCSLFRHDTEFYSSLDMLNDEIEIIEEDKEIEEIEPITGAYDGNELIGVFANKLNEIIRNHNKIMKNFDELKKGK